MDGVGVLHCLFCVLCFVCVNGFALLLVPEIVGCTFVVLVVLFGFVGCRPEIVKTNPSRLDRGDRTIHGKYTQDACVAKPSVCLM